MKLTRSQEEYIKIIYILENKQDIVRVTDIANKLLVTKPSVTRTLKKLSEIGMVNYQTYGTVTLTDSAKKVAKEVIVKQDTLKNFLYEILDVDLAQAEKEAKYLKYYLSEDTIKKIDEHVSSILDLGNTNCNCSEKSSRCSKCIKYTMKKKIENRRIKC